MADKDHEALVLLSKDSTHDQSSWNNMTNGAASDSTTCPAKIPDTFHAAKAIDLETGAEASSAGADPQQELYRRLTSTYQYSPLANDSDNIRVLDLFPGERNNPIRARLEICSLSDRPSYEAISYAWGSKNDNAGVTICEGGVDYTIQIPKSLYGALRQLRHQSGHCYVWADAICMNQADDQEKNHQVRLMRKIYQGATMVVIWLGDDDDIACGGDSLLRLIDEISRDDNAIPPPEDQDTWTAIARLFSRSWFTRVWCLQEAILAPAAKVTLGEHSTSWKHVGRAARWIYSAPTQIPPGSYAMTGVHNAFLMYWLSKHHRGEQTPSFLRLLSVTRPFKASDSRDKIYGILGIPTANSDPDAGDLFLQPDYTKTVSEVYIECALAAIQKTQSLHLLLYVQHEYFATWRSDISEEIEADDTLVNVPSWVPRWHRYSATSISRSEHVTTDFKASSSLKFDPGLKPEVRALELVTYGARIVTVKSVSRVFHSDTMSPQNAPYTANAVWEGAFDHLKASTTDTTEALYALSTLLTAGQDWYGRIIKDTEQHFADFLAFMYNPGVLSDGDTAMGQNQADGRSTEVERSDGGRLGHPNMLQDSLFRPRTDFAIPLAGKPGQGYYFKVAMRRMCSWRCLVVTEDGHVGLGPEATRPGDVVCILKDAPMPLLLRAEDDGDKFKLVGQAYIQGMMFGEITKSEPEQIVLSDKPFVSLPRDGQLEAQNDQSD